MPLFNDDIDLDVRKKEGEAFREKANAIVDQLIADGWKVWEITALGRKLSDPSSWDLILSVPPKQE